MHRIRADSHDEMIAAVAERIPVGTPLSEARKTMEVAGFECDFLTDAWFTEDPGFIGSDRDKYRSIDDARYLSCKRNESAGFLVSRLWTVAIVVDEHDNVKDVLVLRRMEGP